MNWYLHISYRSSQRIIFRSKFNSLFQKRSPLNPHPQFSFGIYLTLSMQRKMFTTLNSMHLKSIHTYTFILIWSDNFIITYIGIYCLDCVSDWPSKLSPPMSYFILLIPFFSVFNSRSFCEMINPFIISLQFLSPHVARFIFKLFSVVAMEPSGHRMDLEEHSTSTSYILRSHLLDCVRKDLEALSIQKLNL